ncbi:MAG: hypothetical protein N3B12_07605 [Armatimonadetes bacterium]|nr:hypothetical protein [Armatimonadota bacterium]
MRSIILLVVVLAVATTIAFRDILWLPYLGDDWAILHKMAFRTPAQILRLCFDTSLLQIRPLQYLYTWAILALFGSYSSAFHIPALIGHVFTALMVVLLIRLVVGSVIVGWLVGFLYALSIAIHLAPQMWLVGSSDIFGPMLVFASLVLLIKGRYTLSAIAFLGSLLFKEFALAMLVLMALLVARQERCKGLWIGFKCVAAKLWNHVLFATPFLVYKIMFLPSPLSFPPDHPYKMSFVGPHLIKNGVYYMLWLLQSVCPFMISRPRLMIRTFGSQSALEMALFVAFVLLVVAALVLAIARLRTRKPISVQHERSPYFLLLVWAVTGMTTVYFLPNHVFAYYMAYSLPALLAIIVLLARDIARWASVRKREMLWFAVAAVVLQFVWSSVFVRVSAQAGDIMLRGAYQVVAVHDLLLRHYPDVPSGTTFVLEGDGIMWALRDDKAIQLWYMDRSLRVFDRQFVAIREGRIYAFRPPPEIEFPGTPLSSDKVELNSNSLISLKVVGDPPVAVESPLSNCEGPM